MPPSYMQPSAVEQLEEVFRPHRFRADEHHIDLYHVCDNLSRTPYQHGIGIQCEDPDEYFMNAWHVITPSAMMKHLDWRNRTPTQFISFYDKLEDAEREAQRRRYQLNVPDGGRRFPGTVRIAHVRLPWNTNVWAFSRAEMLSMMSFVGGQAHLDILRFSARGEWFVWGNVPDEFVLNRHLL
jgi:hypothetical protein